MCSSTRSSYAIVFDKVRDKYFGIYIANYPLLPDYIICGGGTAGLAIASRLSEDENVTVAILEAGGNALNDLLVDAPSMYTQTWGNPNYDWDYKTVPQVYQVFLQLIALTDFHDRKGPLVEFMAGSVAKF